MTFELRGRLVQFFIERVFQEKGSKLFSASICFVLKGLRRVHDSPNSPHSIRTYVQCVEKIVPFLECIEHQNFIIL